MKKWLKELRKVILVSLVIVFVFEIIRFGVAAKTGYDIQRMEPIMICSDMEETDYELGPVDDGPVRTNAN